MLISLAENLTLKDPLEEFLLGPERSNVEAIKNQCCDQFLAQASTINSQNCQFFRNCFRRKYFLGHSSDPWNAQIG
jgi:hypothetical protein